MIKQNMGGHKCWYFSTEMNAQTVKKRLEKAKDSIDWNFEIIENWDQYGNSLKPDDLNFCDWLEAGEKPYEVASKVSQLQQKMRKGVIIVAMQKNPHNAHAIGGYQTMAKSALYITVDRIDENDFTKGQYMKVTKAKAFEGENPNGFVCEFKIVQGIDLIQGESWGPEMFDRYEQFRDSNKSNKSNRGNK